MAEVLGVLSVRPPTPPKTTFRTVPHNGGDHSDASPTISKTPCDSSLSGSVPTSAPSTRTSKRVNFSLSPKFIKPPSFTNGWQKSKSDLRTLTPSNKCKPVKSILKATQSPAPNSAPIQPPDTPESFAMFLESVTQQLAGESTSSRLDAYMQLFGVLMAYEKAPGEQEMAGKLGLIAQFILRDLSRNPGGNGPLDTNLTTQALKLSAAFVWYHEISAQLPDDFKVFLVEHSISCLQDNKVPKSVLIHWMSILATQDFTTKIMTNSRIARLLVALQDITERVSGSAVTAQRLGIYHRILRQSKSTFVSHSALWMEHLIHGLLSYKKDIRLKAITLGFQTSMMVGPNVTLSKILRDTFDRELSGSRKLVSEVCGRLSRMMTPSDSAAHVPQAWSVVVLLLRSKNWSIDQWEHFVDWILIIQKCFSRSEPSVKTQTILGWNRFVFAISPNEATSPKVLKMLRRPIESHFGRKKQSEEITLPNQLALSSYYSLLYYAFRPSASYSHLDAVWEEYVYIPASETFTSTPALCDRFSEALCYLLWSSQGKVWAESKPIETNKLGPEELPSIDCKWIRSRIATVLKVFERIFSSSIWIDDATNTSNIAAAWTALSNALRHASSKEITPSAESMQVVAHILSLLRRLWMAGPSSLNAVEDGCMNRFFDRFRFLSTTIIYSLGGILFTDRLVLKTSDETFQAASTPTHHCSKKNSNLVSPIVHFLQLIGRRHGVPASNVPYLQLVNDSLEAACSGRTSRGLRLEFLRQCTEPFLEEGDSHVLDTYSSQAVWGVAAQLATESLLHFPIDSARERDESILRDYENVKGILVSGLKFPDSCQAWSTLFDTFIDVVRSEKGEVAVSHIAIEPTAESSARIWKATYSTPAAIIRHTARVAPYCYGVLHADESDTNTVVNQSEYCQAPLPGNVMELADKALRESYHKFSVSEMGVLADFLESLASLLRSGSVTFGNNVLERLQKPLALWLKDEARQFGTESERGSIVNALDALSSAVVDILKSHSPHDTLFLQKFEPIISAGLGSSSMPRARKFINVWSSVFKLQEPLGCPASISYWLERLNVNQTFQSPYLVQPENIEAEVEQRPTRLMERSFLTAGGAAALQYSSGPGPMDLTSPADTITRKTFDIVSRRQQAEGKARQPQEHPVSHAVDSPPLSARDERSRRSELLSIMDGLQSSSPVTGTPGRREPKTPPHLRDLDSLDPEARIFLTPTLLTTASENGDVFLGSSPTPVVRDQTQARNMSSSALGDSLFNGDPLLSSTELRLPCTRARHRNRASELSEALVSRTGDNLTEKMKNKAAPEAPATSASTPVPNGKPSHTITNYDRAQDTTLGNSYPSEQPCSAVRKATKAPYTRGNLKISPTRTLRHSARKPTRPVGFSSSAAQREKLYTQQDKKIIDAHTGNVSDGSDSGSDDPEAQIASQLERDMALALDRHESANGKEAEPPGTNLVSKKRKREAESSSVVPASERRRSTRFSNKGIAADNSAKASRARGMVGNNLVSNSPEEPSRSGSALVKLRAPCRRAPNSSTPSASVNYASHTDIGVENVMEPTHKRRKSSRLGKHIDSRISDDTPSQPETPRGYPRGRNGNKAGKARKSLQRSGENPAKKLQQLLEPRENDGQVFSGENPALAPLDCVRQPSQNLAGSSTTSSDGILQGDTEMQGAGIGADSAATIQIANRITSWKAQSESDRCDTAILQNLRNILDDVKLVSLSIDTLKEVDNLLFEIRLHAHDALKKQQS